MNLIRNGNFEEWPLGTSFSIAAGTSTTPLGGDLSYVAVGVNQPTATVSRQAFTFGGVLKVGDPTTASGTIVDGAPHYFLQFVPGTAPTAGTLTSAYLKWTISGDLSLKERVGTLTFWANTTVSREIVLQVSRQFIGGTGPGGQSEVVCATQSVQLRAGWRRYKMEFRFPTFTGAIHASTDVTNVKIFFEGDVATLGSHQVQWKQATLSFSQVAFTPYALNSFEVESLANSILAAGDGYDLDAPRDGVSDALAAFNTALASRNTIRLTPGTYYISANLTIAAGKSIIFENGAKIKPASGVKVMFVGEIQAERFEIFDYSAGGTCVLSFFSRTNYIFPEWYGAAADNSTNNSPPFTRILAATGSDNLHPIILDSGYYNFVTGITLKSKIVFVASRVSLTRMQLVATVGPACLLTIPNGSDSIILEGIQFNAVASAGVRTTGIGNAVATDSVSRLTIKDCWFSGFNQDAICVGKGQYVQLIGQSFFNNISNSVANGGTGAGPAVCIRAQTFLNVAQIEGCPVTACDKFSDLATGNSVTIDDGSFEAAPSTITGRGSYISVSAGSAVRVINNYFEGNSVIAGSALIDLVGVNGYSIDGNTIEGRLPGGTLSVTNTYIKIGVGSKGGSTCANKMAPLPLTKYIDVDPAAENPKCSGNVFMVNGTPDTALTTFAALSPYITNTLDVDLGPVNNRAKAVQHRSFDAVTNVMTRTVTFSHILTSGVPVAGFGVGINYTCTKADGTEATIGDSGFQWNSLSAGTEYSDWVLRCMTGGAMTTAVTMRGVGGMVIRGPLCCGTRQVAVDTTLTASDCHVTVTATAKTITLTNSTLIPVGWVVEIKLAVGSAATCTINCVDGGATIDGSATHSLTTDQQCVVLRLSASGKWRIVSKYIP